QGHGEPGALDVRFRVRGAVAGRGGVGRAIAPLEVLVVEAGQPGGRVRVVRGVRGTPRGGRLGDPVGRPWVPGPGGGATGRRAIRAQRRAGDRAGARGDDHRAHGEGEGDRRVVAA